MVLRDNTVSFKDWLENRSRIRNRMRQQHALAHEKLQPEDNVYNDHSAGELAYIGCDEGGTEPPEAA